MTVKAVAHIIDANYNSNGVTFDVRVMDANNSVQTSYGPISVEITELTLNADIKAFAREYAETNFGTTFNIGDTVRLIHHVGS